MQVPSARPAFSRTFALVAVAALATACALLPGGRARIETRAIYLALGDSVAYGMQPNFDVSHGYAEDLFARLQGHGAREMVNFSCPGETSASMLSGGCRFSFLAKTPYLGPQITTAVAFIQAHPGQVGPVTLTIGANDVTDDLGPDCAEHADAFAAHLDQLGANLDQILRQLTAALGGPRELLVTTYYNPYQDACPGTGRYLDRLNGRIAAVARGRGVRVVDISPAFTGQACEMTWMCSRFRDIHPTTSGYTAIADRLAAAVVGAGRRIMLSTSSP